MTRKLVVGVLGLAVAAVALWWVLRGRGDHRAASPAGPARSASLPAPAPTGAPAQPAPPGPPPRAAALRWALDVDREGPLQLEGQVVGPDGRGVGGAEVTLGSVPPRTARSEDDGTFSFDKLVGRTYALSASHGQLLGGPVRYKLTAHSDPVVLRLAEAAAVTVTVTDEAKQPIKDADVKVGELAGQTARTSEQGKARLAPVRPGWFRVEGAAAGYAPSSALAQVGTAGATAEVALMLRKGVAVSGRVLDDAGKPVAKARVTVSRGLLGEDGGDANTATSDERGGFTLAALAAGSYTLTATDGEHAPAQSTPVTVSDRPITNVEIVMRAGGSIAGKVVDASHKPVAFATVRVASTGIAAWQSEARQATTDQQGMFELRGLGRSKLQARAESDAAASKVHDVDLSD